MTFDNFIETAWNDHADRPQEVADRLVESLHIVAAPEHIAPFARIVTHVYGEHLDQARRGIEVLERLRASPAFDGSASALGALDRNIVTLRVIGGDGSALDSLSSEDRTFVLAMAASAFGGRKDFAKALAAYAEAIHLADCGLPEASPANRALAVGGNNLAAALEEKSDRGAAETAGMVDAATNALKYWKRAGTWIEEERAEFRLTRSLLKAGNPTAAIQSATRCIAVCTGNNAPAIETFYGYVVLALAMRAAGDASGFASARRSALALYEQVPLDERKWCASEIAELG